MAGPVVVLALGLPGLVPALVGVAAAAVGLLFLAGVLAFAYRVATEVERPVDVLFEESDEDEGVRPGREDEEWDYY